MIPVLACFLLSAALDGSAGPATDVPELKVLDHYRGDWSARSTFKTKEPGAAERHATGTAHAEWVMGGRFLRQTWTIESQADQPELSGMSLMSYDPAGKVYREWTFASTGHFAQAEGRWDPDTNTMTWTGHDDRGGVETTTRAHFEGDDVEDWTIINRDRAGKTLSEMTGRNTRTK